MSQLVLTLAVDYATPGKAIGIKEAIAISRCGSDKEFRYSAGNVLCAVYTQGWNSYGAALYCPECSATWDERNKDRSMAGPENTIGLIDELYRRSKRRFSP